MPKTITHLQVLFEVVQSLVLHFDAPQPLPLHLLHHLHHILYLPFQDHQQRPAPYRAIRAEAEEKIREAVRAEPKVRFRVRREALLQRKTVPTEDRERERERSIVARGAHDNVEVVVCTVNKLNPRLRDTFDVRWNKVHLQYMFSIETMMQYICKRTLSAHSASRYPGPGVSRRHATGKSGTTVV